MAIAELAMQLQHFTKMYECIISIQIDYCKFLAEYKGERIMKIGQHLPKL